MFNYYFKFESCVLGNVKLFHIQATNFPANISHFFHLLLLLEVTLREVSASSSRITADTSHNAYPKNDFYK